LYIVRIKHFSQLILLVLIFLSCTEDGESPLFTKLSSKQSGIHFNNSIENNTKFNTLNYPLFYNGAGVGMGDINNDGLPDLFFGGNKVSSRLYLNKGNMKFEDITQLAGVSMNKWITGVSMVDINNDGFLDIYLSVVSTEFDPPDSRRNLLFINNGDTTFTESAKVYGLDDSSFTTHATFLDYNKDGYLDVFLLNHSPGAFYYDMANQESKIKDQSPSYDRLYRNNGDGTFTNVSKEAGILETLGYGLGVVVADFNRDNWPDIYVSNDLLPDDVLYMNNKNGTFTNKASEYLKHTSSTGMGVDAADFDDDGWTDLIQVDMMPKNYKERKVKSGIIDYEYFSSMREKGYDHTYSQNSFQWHQGIDQRGNLVFSEIGRLTGVAYTEWSWAALFGDYDNDGLKDIIVTNGYPKDVNNYDYLMEVNDLRGLRTNQEIKQYMYQVMKQLKPIERPNYFFRNEGGLKFSDISEQWGFREPSFSYGVAHGDLDNDGDMDVVINNINAPASIYRNTTSETPGNHYLLVRLEGDSLNRQGIGAKLRVVSGEQKQYAYHTIWRGYESTMEERLHFGLGKAEQVDSLEIIWPDGRSQILTNVKADQMLTLDYKNAEAKDLIRKTESLVKNRIFQKPSSQHHLNHKHQVLANKIDYEIQPLLPYQISRQGPPLATGDVTGNGLDDVFIGGSAGYSGTLFLQQKDGVFVESKNQPWQSDSLYTDWGAHFFDANGNGLLDLYIASGGYQISPASELLQDRLYINMGKGQFIRDRHALPNMLTSTSAVVSGDFTGNNKIDLFVGGRLKPQKYPYPARSWLLQNNGGTFDDVTEKVAPQLTNSGGMITDAVWMDFNDDDRLDLVTVGEWMPIQFFENRGDHLYEVSQSMSLPPNRGWWYSLEKGDFNGDGSPDLIAGNLGLNFTYTTSEEKQFGVFASDFNRDRTSDIVLSIKEEDSYYPFFGKAKFDREMQFAKKQFPTFQSFAEASLSEIFGTKNMERALHYTVDTFASVYLQRNAKEGFVLNELPEEAQLSAIMGLVIEDIDKDGHTDVILAGNMYHTEPETPRNDAGNGLWMRGDGKGGFEPLSPFKSGLYASGNVKDVSLINTPKGKAIIFANNSDSLQIFQIK